MSKIKAFFTKHDLAHKLIAILMAIALWFIVVANNDESDAYEHDCKHSNHLHK